MSTTTSIKVTYDSISRRFSIPTDSPNWLDLERQIRTLFQIPALKINVFYIDEDGDEITVSSDLELEEILKQFTYNNKNKPIKLVVTTIETSDTSTISTTNVVTTAIDAFPNKIEDESWVIEGGVNNSSSSDSNNNSSKEKQKSIVTPYKMADSGGDTENDEDNEFIIYITSDHPWHNSFLGLNRGGYNRCNGRSNFYGPPSQFSEENTDLSDKVKILNEMGFPEAKNAKHEILLRKFNGNIERVVEVLLYWQQNNHYDANKHDNHKENNGGSSTSSSKEVDEVY
ncbi:1605_t:CDS:2 [Entrophospora sp. SA101]|nr:1605_t:CDS:2 [Entrophospora sp. SA101]